MAEIPTGEYIHRSIDQLRSMNERGTLGVVIHDYKQFTDLRNNIITDYTIKNNLNNNNNHLIDNRNTSSNINNNQPSNIVEQKHQAHQHYSSPSTPPTPLSITDAQMNDAKVSNECSTAKCTFVSPKQKHWNIVENLFWRHRRWKKKRKWLKKNILGWKCRNIYFVAGSCFASEEEENDARKIKNT